MKVHKAHANGLKVPALCFRSASGLQVLSGLFYMKGSDYPCFDHTAAFRNSDFTKGWIPVTGIIQTKINNFKVIDFTHSIYTLEGQKKFPRYLVEKRSN